MDSPIVTQWKSRRELDRLLRHVTPRSQKPTPRDDLDWLMKQLESLIAELSPIANQ